MTLKQLVGRLVREGLDRHDPARPRRVRRPAGSRSAGARIAAREHPPLVEHMGSKARSDVRVILIGGSSHVGKSTLARSLADTLGWRLLSTDTMARHPGRPWRSAPEPVPDHVAEHYLTLSVGELITDVLHHYRINVWPTVWTLIRSATAEASSDRLILEGSALWPEFAATLGLDGLAALWLNVLQCGVEELADRCLTALNREWSVASSSIDGRPHRHT